MSKEIKTLDLTGFFRNKKLELFFTNKYYGGHLNPKGNKYVAKIIAKFLEKMKVKN